MIHVCFGLHDADGKYSKFVGTTMASIFENTNTPPQSIMIHILHDDTLTDDNREKFSWLAGRYNQLVKFHNVEKLCPDELKYLREKLADKLSSRFSVGTFYRLLIKKIIGNGKVIYLDADIVVNTDIAELWNIDLHNFPIAAVPEIEATHRHMITNKFLINIGGVRVEDYFCAGVTMFDFDKIYDSLFIDGVNFLATYPACEAFDQDILNAFFSKNYLKLPQKFDSFVLAEKAPVTNKIYHYAGNAFEFDTSNVFNRLWLEYFAKTPWFNVEALENFAEEIRKTVDKLTEKTQSLMKNCVERRRAFLVHPYNVEVVKFIFSVRDDEPIIEIRDESFLAELVNKMNELRGQRTFFLFHENYAGLQAFLLQHGFVEQRDFVDGMNFMTREQCRRKRPEYHFVRAM